MCGVVYTCVIVEINTNPGVHYRQLGCHGRRRGLGFPNTSAHLELLLSASLGDGRDISSYCSPFNQTVVLFAPALPPFIVRQLPCYSYIGECSQNGLGVSAAHDLLSRIPCFHFELSFALAHLSTIIMDFVEFALPCYALPPGSGWGITQTISTSTRCPTAW